MKVVLYCALGRTRKKPGDKAGGHRPQAAGKLGNAGHCKKGSWASAGCTAMDGEVGGPRKAWARSGSMSTSRVGWSNATK